MMTIVSPRDKTKCVFRTHLLKLRGRPGEGGRREGGHRLARRDGGRVEGGGGGQGGGGRLLDGPVVRAGMIDLPTAKLSVSFPTKQTCQHLIF